jgi:hypothetical protein
LILKLVVTDFLPFSVFESESLKELLLFFNSSLMMWSRSTARRVLLKVYRRMKVQVKETLASNKGRVSLTTDMWTSVAGE